LEQRLVPAIRILIVEDFLAWRRQVRLLLQAQPEWQVISEAADGSEAVQKAEELKPDLIVLDIGLPKLNGIEVARRVRQISPSTRIVFLSQDNDWDIVEAALGTNAWGYVQKTRAQSDLLPAVAAVLQGKKFISSSLKGDDFIASPGVEGNPQRHEVLFYADDKVLLDRVVQFIAVVLKAGDAAIVIATKAHRDSLLQRLRAEGVDTDGAVHRGILVSLDVVEAVSTYMVKDWPDEVRFLELFTKLIESASRGAKAEHPRVAIFGEGVALLWAEGKEDAAIRVEQLCNDLAKTYKVDILCAYPLSSFYGEADEHVFQSICAQHSADHVH
jgi:DNA-binding NarL/FixJ family response regulator